MIKYVMAYMYSAKYAWATPVVKKLIGLTHRPLVPYMCVIELDSIVLGNGLPPDRRQIITWTNTGWLSTGPLGTHFSDIRIKIQNFSFKKLHMKMLSSKWRPLKLED